MFLSPIVSESSISVCRMSVNKDKIWVSPSHTGYPSAYPSLIMVSRKCAGGFFWHSSAFQPSYSWPVFDFSPTPLVILHLLDASKKQGKFLKRFGAHRTKELKRSSLRYASSPRTQSLPHQLSSSKFSSVWTSPWHHT